ncbi:hypothetical protein [Aestuariimicrobium ganziense]|uniref:hypothetical protein n=1 Tax=Aestuariimicrobium ganziense TaxID=2773677 RepID=UPI001941BB75|nr:hypothetical protein [Aestuariimicrobium ganziense]
MAAFGSRLPSIQAHLDITKGTIGTILIGMTVGSLLGLGAGQLPQERALADQPQVADQPGLTVQPALAGER